MQEPTLFDYINYLSDILNSESLQQSDQALYLNLLIIANKRFWKFPLNIPNKVLVLQIGMDDDTISRARNRLKQKGLIDFKPGNGKLDSPKYWLIARTTIPNNTGDGAGGAAGDTAGIPADIYKTKDKDSIPPLSPYIGGKDNFFSKNENTLLHTEVEKKEKSSAKKEKKELDLSFVPPDWLPLVQEWLEYKKAKHQKYQNEKSIKKFFSHLQNLSGTNIALAKLIITQSIGNNYAGIFPLKQGYEKPTNPTIQKPKVIQKFH